LKLYLHTVGCAKNLVDSEILLGQMANQVELVDEGALADLIVVNTCGFIDAAREESVDAIMEALELKTQGDVQRVVVMGCLSERYKEDLDAELPDLDGIYGIGDFGRILREAGLKPLSEKSDRDDLELFANRILLSPAHSAYLRISDGCNQSCTYCSIPMMRGKMHSRRSADLIDEARALLLRGVKEINVIGQEISSYGSDLDTSADICSLIGALDTVQAPWVRLLYSHPPLVDERFAKAMAQAKTVLPYLDFPVEHVAGSVLKRMGRRGDATSMAKKMTLLRSYMPEMILRTSIIVGFPGESESDFRELMDFCKSQPFDRLGVFLWSPEEGTPALKLDSMVPREVAEERRDALMEQQMEISLSANEALVGTTQRVLVDEADNETGTSIGRTWRDAIDIDNTVEIDSFVEAGSFVDVHIREAAEYDLFASLRP
jgi:ribosomal protein S12 methylthiotransferase